MLKALAANGARRRGEGKCRIGGACDLGRAAETVPHLAFEPFAAQGAAMQNAGSFLGQRANARCLRSRRIGMIDRRLAVAERQSGSSEAALMCSKIEA